MEQMTFSPKEAAALTGVSPVQQRDWRRHGFIESEREGWTAFNGVGLSALFIIKAFSTLGTVAQGAAVAKQLAPPLGAYVEALATGKTATAPQDCAVALKGGVGVFGSIQEAVDAAEADGMPVVQIMPLQAIATGFAIRVRDAWKAKAK